MAAFASPSPLNGSNSYIQNSSYPTVLLDELWNNLTNREEILRRWSEKLRLEREEHERIVLLSGSGNSGLANMTGGAAGSEQFTETSLSFPPDSIWPLLWIALYAAVLIVIIVVAIKACILLFEKTDDSKFEDTKDSPNILRMAVAGRNNIIGRGCSNPVAVPAAALEHQRSISPRSVILQQPSPNSTRPCYIYNAGAYNYSAVGVGLANSGGTCSSAGSCSWTHPFMGMGTVAAGCCSKAAGQHHGKGRRLLRSSGRGVSLESELMMTPCGNYYLHHNVHSAHAHGSAAAPPHHHSQQQLCTMTMSVTPPTATITIPGASPSASASAGTRNQKQYQYQHQHTNDSSLQWDSLNTNTTDHSGESPPSYEIALGVEIASRPQSGTGNCSDREGEGSTAT